MHVKPKPVGSFRPLLPGFQGSVSSVLRIQLLLGLGAGYPSGFNLKQKERNERPSAQGLIVRPLASS